MTNLNKKCKASTTYLSRLQYEMAHWYSRDYHVEPSIAHSQ